LTSKFRRFTLTKSDAIRNNRFWAGSYRRLTHWFEARLSMTTPCQRLNNSQTVSESEQSATNRRLAVSPRLIQIGAHGTSIRYHIVTWDVRHSSSGVKEWLESVQQGDIVGVYLRSLWDKLPVRVEKIEVDVYCEY
jgi:hypothetical protein